MSIIRYFSLDYYLNRLGYTKAGSLEIGRNAPLTDEDIERIDISFAKDTRELVRWLGANGTDVPAVVNANRVGVIGAGLNIQSRIENEPELNKSIEKFIRKWSKKGTCEITGRFHLNSALRAMVEATDKDGGFLVRHHVKAKWKIPYKFQLIELGMIDTSQNNDKYRILNGIQTDEDGRITYIYLFTDSTRSKSTPVNMNQLDYFSPVWVSLSQYTAVSKFASVLPSIDQLDRYTDAELKAAIAKAKNGKYWKTGLYDDLMKIIRAEKDDQVRREQLSTLMSRLAEQGVKPEGLTAIPINDSIEKTDEPSASVYPNLTKNVSNYSSIKAMLQIAGVEWNIRFDDLKEEIIDFIMSRAIREGVSCGEINIPGFYRDPEKYIQLDYMRVSEIDIEPKKTADANNIRYNELKDISLREICRKRGRDVEDVIRERVEEEMLEQKIRAELGATGGTQ